MFTVFRAVLPFLRGQHGGFGLLSRAEQKKKCVRMGEA